MTALTASGVDASNRTAGGSGPVCRLSSRPGPVKHTGPGRGSILPPAGGAQQSPSSTVCANFGDAESA